MASASVGAGTKVCVAVRVRPLIERETKSQSVVHWSVANNVIQQVETETEQRIRPNYQPYVFDHVFPQATTTKEVYDKVVAPIVDKAFNGFNGTVLCYGQTSSGKTYTLYGSDTEDGIISITSQDLFRRITEDDSRIYIIRVGLIEIYNEKVTDLLQEGQVEIQIVENNGVIVPKDLEEIQILKPEDILKAAQRIQRERKIGETQMNKESSRSHTILRILIESVPRTPDPDTDFGEQVHVTNALLNFVDLAGSEKASQTGAQGERFKEATYINKSLSVLSQVVMQLSEDVHTGTGDTPGGLNLSVSRLTSTGTSLTKRGTSRFVNYRDSKLTRILQSSLSGNAIIAMICNITPASIDETHSTLRFARTTKKVHTKPRPNVLLSSNQEYQQAIEKLQNLLCGKSSEVEDLKRQLSVYMKFCQYSSMGICINPIMPTVFSDRRKTICSSLALGPREDTLKSNGVPSSVFSDLPPVRKTHGSARTSLGSTFSISDEKLMIREETMKRKVSRDSWEGLSDDRVKRLDAQVQTEQLSPEPPQPKRVRLEEPNNETPIKSLRTQIRLIAAGRDDDRAVWDSDKEFLQAERSKCLEQVEELIKNNIELSTKNKQLEDKCKEAELNRDLVEQITVYEFKNKQLERRNTELLARSVELQTRVTELESGKSAKPSREHKMNNLIIMPQAHVKSDVETSTGVIVADAEANTEIAVRDAETFMEVNFVNAETSMEAYVGVAVSDAGTGTEVIVTGDAETSSAVLTSEAETSTTTVPLRDASTGMSQVEVTNVALNTVVTRLPSFFEDDVAIQTDPLPDQTEILRDLNSQVTEFMYKNDALQRQNSDLEFMRVELESQIEDFKIIKNKYDDLMNELHIYPTDLANGLLELRNFLNKEVKDAETSIGVIVADAETSTQITSQDAETSTGMIVADAETNTQITSQDAETSTGMIVADAETNTQITSPDAETSTGMIVAGAETKAQTTSQDAETCMGVTFVNAETCMGVAFVNAETCMGVTFANAETSMEACSRVVLHDVGTGTPVIMKGDAETSTAVLTSEAETSTSVVVENAETNTQITVHDAETCTQITVANAETSMDTYPGVVLNDAGTGTEVIMTGDVATSTAVLTSEAETSTGVIVVSVETSTEVIVHDAETCMEITFVNAETSMEAGAGVVLNDAGTGTEVIMTGDAATSTAVLTSEAETSTSVVVANAETNTQITVHDAETCTQITVANAETSMDAYPGVVLNDAGTGTEVIMTGDVATSTAVLTSEAETSTGVIVVNVETNTEVIVHDAETCMEITFVNAETSMEAGAGVVVHDAGTGTEVIKTGDAATSTAVLTSEAETSTAAVPLKDASTWMAQVEVNSVALNTDVTRQPSSLEANIAVQTDELPDQTAKLHDLNRQVNKFKSKSEALERQNYKLERMRAATMDKQMKNAETSTTEISGTSGLSNSRTLRVNRTSQTDDLPDQEEVLKALKRKCFVLNDKVEKSEKIYKHDLLKERRRLEECEMKLAAAESKVEESEHRIVLVRSERLQKKPTNVGETQCDLMQDLIKRSMKGEPGLLPAGYPEIGLIATENKSLRHRILETATEKGKAEKVAHQSLLAEGSPKRPRFAKPAMLRSPVISTRQPKPGQRVPISSSSSSSRLRPTTGSSSLPPASSASKDNRHPSAESLKEKASPKSAVTPVIPVPQRPSSTVPIPSPVITLPVHRSMDWDNEEIDDEAYADDLLALLEAGSKK